MASGNQSRRLVGVKGASRSVHLAFSELCAILLWWNVAVFVVAVPG